MGRKKAKTGICDFCEAVVPWSECRSVNMGRVMVGMCACRKCRKLMKKK